MIFKPELCEAILQKYKTQTRRLVKSNEIARIREPIGQEICGVWTAGHRVTSREVYASEQIMEVLHVRKWIVGHTYAIQPGCGKKAVGRICIMGIRRERLQDITGKDAIAEGFQPIQHTAPGIVLIPDPKIVDAIAIEMFVEYWDDHHRPQNRWHGNPEVWVLEFELV